MYLYFLLVPVLCTINLNYASSSCVCDITNACDYLCCCDQTCDSALVSAWKESNTCNPPNGNALPINMCSSPSQPQLSDLHSGLRMIYDVIKRLLCIQTINFNASDPAFNTRVTSAAASSLIDSYVSSLSSSSASTSGLANPYSQFLTQYTFNGSPLELPGISGNSHCRWSSQYTTNDLRQQLCKSTLSTGDFHLIQTYRSKYGQANVFYQDGTQVDPANSTTNPSTSWTNIVKEALFRITLNQDQTTVTKVEVQLGVTSIVDYAYTVYSVNVGVAWVSSNTSYQRASNVGYAYSSPLIVVDNTSSVSVGSVRVSFMDGVGECLSSSTSNNIWDLKFGEDLMVNCIQTTTTNLTLLTGYITQAFNKLGALGAANPTFANDFITIDGQLISSGGLSIFYKRIGEADNSQFQITSARFDSPSQTATSTPKLFSFFIEFKEMPSQRYVYTPPPPTVQIRLDNDVLYPFHMY